MSESADPRNNGNDSIDSTTAADADALTESSNTIRGSVSRTVNGHGYAWITQYVPGVSPNGSDWMLPEHQLVALSEFDASKVFGRKMEVHHEVPVEVFNLPSNLDVISAREHAMNHGSGYDPEHREVLAGIFKDVDADADPETKYDLLPCDKLYQDPEVLRILYHDRDLNQTEIAEKFGVDQSTVSRQLRKHGIKESDE